MIHHPSSCIYVANVASNSVSVIDGSTNTVIATITVPSNQVGQTSRELAFNSNNGDIYVADVYSNTVSVIDGKTNTLLGSIPTGGSIVDGVATIGVAAIGTGIARAVCSGDSCGPPPPPSDN